MNSKTHTTFASGAALPCSPELARDFQARRYIVVENSLSDPLLEAWRTQADRLVATHGVDIRRESGGQLLTYRVVTGDVITALWPELNEFYTAPATREWVRFITGERRIHISRNRLSCININCMARSGESYRWHFDATRYTLLLFLSTSTVADGGAFELVPPSASRAFTTSDHIDQLRQSNNPAGIVSVLPGAGTVIVMDGTVCRHRVAPLLRATRRITIPMVYPAVVDDSRPQGLDRYLYRPD